MGSSSPGVRAGAPEVLYCPRCGDDHVELEIVHVAGLSQADGPVVPVTVHCNGQVTFPAAEALPVHDQSSWRVVSLGGWCEGCSAAFSLELSQHSGQTVIALRHAGSAVRAGRADSS